jgi:hypothetical protein
MIPARPDPPRVWRSVFYPPANYEYFEALATDFRHSPTLGGLNLLKGAWAADAAMLAYGRSGPEPIPPDKVRDILRQVGLACEFIGDWEAGAKGTQGYVAFRDDLLILAFRGTEKEDWTDLAADLATWPVAETETTAEPGEADKTMFHLPPALAIFNRSAPGVHRGFQAALNTVWSDVSRKIAIHRAEHPNAEFWLTGHSLGAALAILAASRLLDPTCAVYTFGAPRVGNQAFQDKLAGIVHYRFVDGHDIVTRVPPGLLWYEHGTPSVFAVDEHGIRVETPTSGWSADASEVEADLKCLAELQFPILDDSTPPPDIFDHSPGCYANRVWNTLAAKLP